MCGILTSSLQVAFVSRASMIQQRFAKFFRYKSMQGRALTNQNNRPAFVSRAGLP